MLKELLSHRSVQVPLVFVILIGISGMLYLNHVKTQTEGDTANTETGAETQEPPPASTPDPSAASTQSGHFHEDGTFHAEPHTPQTDSETITEAEGVRQVAEQTKAQRAAPMPNGSGASAPSSDLSQEAREQWRAWKEWTDKHSELRDEYSQAYGAPLLPTEAEKERYVTDENYRREVNRKLTETAHKADEVYGRMLEHEKKRVWPPGTPPQ